MRKEKNAAPRTGKEGHHRLAREEWEATAARSGRFTCRVRPSREVGEIACRVPAVHPPMVLEGPLAFTRIDLY